MTAKPELLKKVAAQVDVIHRLTSTSLDSWQMHAENAPVFAEYVTLCKDANFETLIDPSPKTIGPDDALIIVDMQNDFVPKDSVNEHGGRLASKESGDIAGLIVDFAELFASRGGMVVATRDYHPVNHCSFLEQGGGCLPHCVQGNDGSHFYKPIGDCLERLCRDGKRVSIVFKGFHEDIESFGAFKYPEVPPPDRGAEFTMTQDCPKERFYGCSSLEAWTGSFCLKCSNLEFEGGFNVNAPPDVLSIFRRETLAERLQSSGIKRVFVCGLVFDLCVMDTSLNAAKAGFDAYLIMDASRPIHLPGVGPIGSGFVNAVEKLQERMTIAGVRLIPSVSLLHTLPIKNPLADSAAAGQVFPKAIGPFHLKPLMTAKVVLRANKSSLITAKGGGNVFEVLDIEGKPDSALKVLRHHGLRAAGTHSPETKITLNEATRKASGIPQSAVTFMWANPIEALTESDANVLSWFQSLNRTAAFLMVGGFMYLDAKGEVVAAMAIRLGSGLSFGSPISWSGTTSEALRGRWSMVTIPFMRAKGAKYFAWISPGEVPVASGQAELSPKNTEHGAFAYLFGDNPDIKDDRDVLFPVVSLPGMKMIEEPKKGTPIAQPRQVAPASATAPATPNVAAPAPATPSSAPVAHQMPVASGTAVVWQPRTQAVPPDCCSGAGAASPVPQSSRSRAQTPMRGAQRGASFTIAPRIPSAGGVVVVPAPAQQTLQARPVAAVAGHAPAGHSSLGAAGQPINKTRSETCLPQRTLDAHQGPASTNGETILPDLLGRIAAMEAGLANSAAKMEEMWLATTALHNDLREKREGGDVKDAARTACEPAVASSSRSSVPSAATPPRRPAEEVRLAGEGSEASLLVTPTAASKDHPAAEGTGNANSLEPPAWEQLTTNFLQGSDRRHSRGAVPNEEAGEGGSSRTVRAEDIEQLSEVVECEEAKVSRKEADDRVMASVQEQLQEADRRILATVQELLASERKRADGKLLEESKRLQDSFRAEMCDKAAEIALDPIRKDLLELFTKLEDVTRVNVETRPTVSARTAKSETCQSEALLSGEGERLDKTVSDLDVMFRQQLSQIVHQQALFDTQLKAFETTKQTVESLESRFMHLSEQLRELWLAGPTVGPQAIAEERKQREATLRSERSANEESARRLQKQIADVALAVQEERRAREIGLDRNRETLHAWADARSREQKSFEQELANVSFRLTQMEARERGA